MNRNENHPARRPIILASASPRRQMLLEGAGVAFTVCVSDAAEVTDPIWTPKRMVRELARRKAAAVAATHPGAFVIGADTLVSLDGEVLGKPQNHIDAVRMLHMLSGRTHQVQTGVCVVLPNGHKLTFSEVSEVTFRALTHDEIVAYVATGEPLDKAGAYAIQGEGRALIRAFHGDYANIVGLPVDRLLMILQMLGAVPVEE
ncbi:MAG: septum formation protein Maf [Clostridia bacterium]|nr:septum formation protein Maf [Clostridia bacterium]